MAAGDERAVERFYRLYFDWLLAQARRCTGRDEAFCLDVVQDVVLRVMRIVRPAKCEAQLRGWLKLLLQTAACDRIRSESRRRKRESAAIIGQASANDEDESRLHWIQEQIAKFDPELVRLIDLRFQRGWTLRRISESLGLSIGTIDGRLRRALSDLRLQAMDQWHD